MYFKNCDSKHILRLFNKNIWDDYWNLPQSAKKKQGHGARESQGQSTKQEEKPSQISSGIVKQFSSEEIKISILFPHWLRLGVGNKIDHANIELRTDRTAEIGSSDVIIAGINGGNQNFHSTFSFFSINVIGHFSIEAESHFNRCHKFQPLSSNVTEQATLKSYNSPFIKFYIILTTQNL